MTVPASGQVQAFGANARRWSLVFVPAPLTASFWYPLGPDNMSIGFPLAANVVNRFDAVDYPGLVSQTVWVVGAVGDVVEVTESVAV